MGQATLERRDPVARQPAVGLDLGLAGTARADPAAEALQMRPQAAHPRQVVLQLGELDLELALGGVGVGGEDVQDDRGAIDDRDAERGLQVALLARGQLVVACDQVGVGGRYLALELIELAGAEVGVGMGLVAALDQLADGGDAGGACSSSSSSVGRSSWPAGTAAIMNARCRARPGTTTGPVSVAARGWLELSVALIPANYP